MSRNLDSENWTSFFSVTLSIDQKSPRIFNIEKSEYKLPPHTISEDRYIVRQSSVNYIFSSKYPTP